MWESWEDFGLWIATVLVNGSQVDFKRQMYAPHASISPSQAPIGSVVRIMVNHWYPQLVWSWNWTYMPEFGSYISIPVPGFFLSRADGNAVCVVTGS